MPIAPLVASQDTDLAKWQDGDQATFLNMACHEIRKFCGWHIAPTISVVDQVYWFGERGLIMLKSTHVTSVDQVTVGHENPQTLELWKDYDWEQPKPWLRFQPQALYGLWHRPRSEPHVRVSFTHGYEETPPDVKAVIFEVMATAMELPASNADRIQTMQYNLELRPDTGIALSDKQKTRLGRYKITKFGGLVRP